MLLVGFRSKFFYQCRIGSNCSFYSLLPDKSVLMIASSIIEQYEIGDIKQIRLSSDRLEAIVTTTQGHFALRTIKYSSQLKRLFYDRMFTDYLANQGFPARRILLNRFGKLAVESKENIYYLIEYYEGAFPADSRNTLAEVQLAECGKQLAKLHRISTSYSGPKNYKPPFSSEKSYKVLTRIRDLIQNKPTKDDFDQLAEIITEVKIHHIVAAPFESASFLRHDNIMNHGDYHAGNLIFGSDGHILAVIDFEYCRDMPRIWDIAWGVTWLCRMKLTEGFGGPIDISRFKSFLASYNSVFPLTKEEQLSLCEMCVSACFHATYLLEHYYLKNSWHSELDLCSELTEWLWWVANRTEVQDAVREVC